MIILWAILGLVLVILEETLFYFSNNTGISEFYMCMFIPMGSFLLSFFLAYMIKNGIQRSGVHKKAAITLFSFFIGFATYISIQYCDYLLFVLKNTGEKTGFINYIIYKWNNYAIISSKYHIVFGANKDLNMIRMVLNIITFSVGTTLFTKMQVADMRECKKCKRYYRKKELLRTDLSCISKQSFKTDFYNSEKLQQWMQSKVDYTKGYYSIVIYYCSNCNKGIITAEKYRPGRRISIHVDYGDVEFIVISADKVIEYVKYIKNRKNEKRGEG